MNLTPTRLTSTTAPAAPANRTPGDTANAVPTPEPSIPSDRVELRRADDPAASAGSAAETVHLGYSPQDPHTLPSSEVALPREKVGTSLSGPRITMEDANNPVTPNADGDYIFAPGTAGFQQASSFAVTDKTLSTFERYLGHTQAWAFEGPLKIHPHLQEGFNAFYLRLDRSVNFFDGYDPVKKETIHGSESFDVVSHEVGHAILDGMKPGLMGWFGSFESKSFHEAFGDVAAFLTALQEDRVLDKLVEQTAGDLKRPNVVAGMAEAFSQGINHAMLGGRMPEDWTLRNANNPHIYVDPETLPKKPATPDDLFKEPHSFSKIFTGAAWDLLAAMAAAKQAEGMTPREAIVAARDDFGQIFAHGVELGPDRMKSFRQMADAMLGADARRFNGKYAKIIGDTFTARHIPHTPAGQAAPALPAVTLPAGGVSGLADADALLTAARAPLGLPSETPMKAEQTWRNAQGETFVRYGWTEELPLDSRTYTELGGSLTLGFDASGQLFHRLYEPIDDAQRASARADIADVMARRAVRSGAPLVRGDLRRADGAPFEAWVERSGDRNKLVKVPMAS